MPALFAFPWDTRTIVISQVFFLERKQECKNNLDRLVELSLEYFCEGLIEIEFRRKLFLKYIPNIIYKFFLFFHIQDLRLSRRQIGRAHV